MPAVTIPNWHPVTLNTIINNHWSVGHKRKKADARIIATYFAHLPKAVGKRRVSLCIILGKGQRAADPDAYHKSLLDALVKCGQLVNDSYKWVELAPVKFIRGEMSTVILLEDLTQQPDDN